ncbi:MAG: glycosyltransferase family 9 protein [Gemmatimonadota bacterium]|nr:glycosyltransferase family 9 protein [Gemmatimonadota bacterium]
MSESPHIVVVKLAALGDVVMASTLVDAIRSRWPNAHLTWVTGEAFAPLVTRLSGIDRVVPVNTTQLLRGGWGARAYALQAVWRRLHGPVYHLGVVAHTDARYDALLWGVRVRERRALRNGRGPGLLGALGARDDRPRAPRPGQWMGADYARLVLPDDVDDADGSSPCLARLTLEPALVDAASEAAGAVVLAPGGARNVLRDDPLRRWPIAHWITLARALRDGGHRVLLVGAAEDRPESQAIMTAVPGVETAVGRTSLLELVALLSRARLLVSHDSGTLHLAMLTRTPAVALFGPTAPAERVPAGMPVVVASAAAGLPCAPCYDGRAYARCALNRCLTELSSARVLVMVDELLRA